MDADSLKASEKRGVTQINLNDYTIEGFGIKDKKGFSVQYDPESSPRSYDIRSLFD